MSKMRGTYVGGKPSHARYQLIRHENKRLAAKDPGNASADEIKGRRTIHVLSCSTR
jgi:hypothetical protein